MKIMSDVSKMWHCMTADDHITPNENNVLFRLYTRNNKDQSEQLNLNFGEDVEALRLKMIRKKRSVIRPLSKDAIIQSQYFIANADIKILIHGYSETLYNTKMMDIKNGELVERKFINCIRVIQASTKHDVMCFTVSAATWMGTMKR